MADEPIKNQNNDGGDGGGTDPKKTDTQNQGTVDLSKLSDEEFAKVFEDKRLYTHPRFKSLSERAHKADELERSQKEAEEKRLAENKEFQKLAELREKERDEAKSKYTQSILDNRIQAEAIKAGVGDLEAVLKLIDRGGIKVAEDGTVTGISEAVTALLTSKPYLKTSGGNIKIGDGTNPVQGQQGIKRFKLSQLQDPEFYRANEKDIMAAYRAGTVEDDMAK